MKEGQRVWVLFRGRWWLAVVETPGDDSTLVRFTDPIEEVDGVRVVRMKSGYFLRSSLRTDDEMAQHLLTT